MTYRNFLRYTFQIRLLRRLAHASCNRKLDGYQFQITIEFLMTFPTNEMFGGDLLLFSLLLAQIHAWPPGFVVLPPTRHFRWDQHHAVCSAVFGFLEVLGFFVVFFVVFLVVFFVVLVVVPFGFGDDFFCARANGI